jgi:hypothetical protein
MLKLVEIELPESSEDDAIDSIAAFLILIVFVFLAFFFSNLVTLCF